MKASWCPLGLSESERGTCPGLWDCPPLPGILRACSCLTPAHLCLHSYAWEREQGSVALAVTQDPARKKPLG